MQNNGENSGEASPLLCLVDQPQTEAQKEAVQWFPKLKTISSIVRKSTVSYDEELAELHAYLKEHGLQAANCPPVAEELLDPSDLAGQELFLVRLHVPIL